MRLAFIKKQYSVHGGAEQYLQTLIRQLNTEGHEIHIFSNRWEEEGGVIFHKVNAVSLGSFLSAVTFNHNVTKAVKRDIRPDCIISFERTTHQDIYRAGEGCHAEWLYIRSKVEPFCKRVSFKINPLHIYLLYMERTLFSNTRLIVANSKMVKDQIIRHYAVPEERIVIIYNGVDLGRFTPGNRDRWRDSIRKGLDLSGDAKLLLFVGSGFRRKGLKTLIESISLIKEEDIKLLVMGRDDTEHYKILAEGHGISDKVIFLEPLKEIERYYAAADIFVLPTLYDPFGNATVEAMASGLPVITTKNNGVAELVKNGQEGFILENPLDAGELADKIYVSLRNSKLMGRKARERAEGFPIERAAREFTEAIKRVNTN